MPDVEIKPQSYRDERPKEHFDRYHERVRSGEPEAKVKILRENAARLLKLELR